MTKMKTCPYCNGTFCSEGGTCHCPLCGANLADRAAAEHYKYSQTTGCYGCGLPYSEWGSGGDGSCPNCGYHE